MGCFRGRERCVSGAVGGGGADDEFKDDFGEMNVEGADFKPARCKQGLSDSGNPTYNYSNNSQ